MNYASQRVAAQIGRVGREATVLSLTETSKDDFGNAEYTYTEDRVVLAFRTYPNRNSEYESDAGTLHQDNPVFIVPTGPDQPQAPKEGSRIQYGSDSYEVGSHTTYDTHVEFFGDQIIDE